MTHAFSLSLTFCEFGHQTESQRNSLGRADRSTGISLATLARARGYRCSIIIPDDVAREKTDLLRKLGAEIDAVRPRGIVDPRHVSDRHAVGHEGIPYVSLLWYTAELTRRAIHIGHL